MNSDTHIEKSDLAYEILTYLAENPSAQDTLDGIAEWWLLEQKIKRETHNVANAVQRLVDLGFLLQTKSLDSKIRYSLNPAMHEEVWSFLQKP